MACTGTYVGDCCAPPPVDDRLRAVASVNGFTTFTRRLNQDAPGERQQLFNGWVLVLNWDFDHAGNNYAGAAEWRRERPGNNHSDPFPNTVQTGDVFPQPFGSAFDMIYDEISLTTAVGRIRKRNEQNITQWDDIGTAVASLIDGLPSAVSAAVADVNSYDPVSGTWGGGYPLDQFVGPSRDRILRTVFRPRSGLPGLNIGTIAPVCGAYPPNAAPLASSLVFFAPTALTGHSAVVTRGIYAPRPAKQLKLVATYTPECGFPGPPVLVECEAVDAEFGVDIVPSDMPVGYQSVSLAVTEHPTGANPC